MEYKNEYDAEEILKALINLSGAEEVSEDDITEMENTMYNILAIAQNEYNRDGYRMIAGLLEKITERFQYGEFN